MFVIFSNLYKKIKKFFLLKNIEVIIWDFDGTLYQNEDLVLALEKAFWKSYQRHSPENNSLDDFRLMAGKYGGWSKAIVEISGKSEIEVIDEVEDNFDKSSFLDRDVNLLLMMDNLNQFQHLILTNSREKDTVKCLEKIGFETSNNNPFFSKIFARDNLNALKPSEKILDKLISFTGKKRKNHLMIGDSYFSDINPAKEFGFKAIHINDFKQLFYLH